MMNNSPQAGNAPIRPQRPMMMGRPPFGTPVPTQQQQQQQQQQAIPPVHNNFRPPPPRPLGQTMIARPVPNQGTPPLPVLSPQQQQSPPPQAINNAVDNNLAAPMANMHINKPGRSKRVYAPMPNSPMPTNPVQNVPYPRPIPQQQQQQQVSQQQTPIAGNQHYQQAQQPVQTYQQQQQMSYPQQQQQQQPERVVNTPLGLPPRSAEKPRINPNQIPSPVQIQTEDEKAWKDIVYGTCSPDTPPLASTNFQANDQGNCNPRFIRATVRDVPQTSDLERDTGLPLGLVIQPLAPLHPNDQPVTLVELNSKEGPVRCSRCKGYRNPWCRYIEGGKKFICNLCGFDNLVPEHQFCPTDMSGIRMDADQHPDLIFGTVEHEVPEEYWPDENKKPEALHHLFCIDVSRASLQTGMLQTVCNSLRGLVEGPVFSKGVKIALVTMDTSVHFYNLHGEKPLMMIVSDINDIFVPMAEGLFVDPVQQKNTILELLNQLPTMFQNTLTPCAVLGASVKAAYLAMERMGGGKVSLFQSLLPTLGPGTLKNRDDPKLYACEREKSLFAPQDKSYTQLGESCAQKGISIDLWFFPPANTYIDVATVGVLSSLTGGETHYFPLLDEDAIIQFNNDMAYMVQREQGYKGALRVRCSNGLSVDDHYGNFYASNSTDIELAAISADTSIGVSLKHDSSKLPENTPVYIQCALLYTTVSGKRVVRVHNLSLGMGTKASNVFKQGDLDTTVNFMVKRAIAQTNKKSLNDLSNEMDNTCVKILTAYRRYCASGASAAQLILPDSFKVLPLLLSSFKKSAVLRKDPSINADTRVYNLRKFKSLGVPGTIRWLYPRLIKLHEWMDQEDKTLFPLERLSYDRFEANGIYWIESNETLFLWIGREASPDKVQAIFGTTDLSNIKLNMLNSVENSLVNQKILELYQLATGTSHSPKLSIIRHGIDLEIELSKVLIEDECFTQMSYVDYLCMIHKQIQTELEREKNDTAIASASYWAYRY